MMADTKRLIFYILKVNFKIAPAFIGEDMLASEWFDRIVM
jgi:hypothetical protein